jgi:hypothetical protein
MTNATCASKTTPADLESMMKNRPEKTMKCLSVASLVFLLCGCSTDPLPGPSDNVAPNPTYTLSGTVSEMTSDGPTPVEGARVTAVVALGSSRTLVATTDRNGFYGIIGTPAGAHAISVEKFGYVTDRRTATMDRDTRFDIQLFRYGTYTLSGVVSEETATGSVPIERVEVYCDSCGPQGHTLAFTDADGFYSFSEVVSGVHHLLVTKEGFRLIDRSGAFPSGTEFKDATVNGDTRFDMQIVRR